MVEEGRLFVFAVDKVKDGKVFYFYDKGRNSRNWSPSTIRKR